MDSKLLSALWIITCATQVLAAHTRLETVGKTYSIVEQDIREEFKQKATGIDLDALFNTHNRYQPANLHPLPRTASDRVFTVDLTHTLDHDIKDNQGNLLYPQGFTFNPLQYAGLSGGLVVIDGSDPEQVEWFKGSPYFQNQRAILLLSGGYAAEVKQELKRPVYYLTHDIAARLQLKAVPSVVVEQDNKLTVREVRLAAKP
jgi:conjugal transfer pilus assembly protein TraW